jgi:AraC-like DNA-binding protein
MCAPSTNAQAQPPGRAGDLVVTQVHDADGHEQSVRGASVRAFRTGRGVGPNLTATLEGAGFVATWVRAGFPMASRATTSPDRVYAIATIAAPPGSRWCDRALDAGEVLFYGPDVNHTAVNPVGVSFAFAAMDRSELQRTAEGLGVKVDLPGSGEIRVMAAPRLHALWLLVASLADPYRVLPNHDLGPELLRTSVEALADEGPSNPCRRLDNGALVMACLDYAEKVDRVPSVDELCAAAFVCRRKLWDAFNERYGTSPARFIRMWGLARARARLVTADPATTTVLQVANDLGFLHAGRFASRYRRTFGELPSQTLQVAG